MKTKIRNTAIRISNLALVVSVSLALAPGCSFADDGTSDRTLALGKRVFERATCEGCHANGNNMLHPNRPIKGAKFQARYKDDMVLEQVIRHGFPSAGMPAFPKHVINDKEMKALIVYVRSFTPKETKKVQ